MMRKSILRCFRFGLAALAFALLLGSSGDQTWAGEPPAMTEEQKKICEKAEQRYQKLYGKPSSEEKGVVIVKMYKYTFCPPQVTVKQGTTVRWVNVERRTSHSVWFKEKGDEESDRLFPEEKVEMTFDLPPGEYPYLCGPHWESEGMIGKVIVVP